jgi:hypothetical protein
MKKVIFFHKNPTSQLLNLQKQPKTVKTPTKRAMKMSRACGGQRGIKRGRFAVTCGRNLIIQIFEKSFETRLRSSKTFKNPSKPLENDILELRKG